MPARVYLESGVLRIDFFDVIDRADFETFIPTMEALERTLPVTPHRIGDLSRSGGMKVDFSAFFSLAERRRAQRFPNAFKTAIVAPQTVHVGLARMFQTLNQHPQITIEIFPTLAAAQAWIAEPPAGAAI